ACFHKGIDPVQRLDGHQVHLERHPGIRPQRLDQVGEEEKGLDVVAVGHVEMKTLGERLDTPDLRREMSQIRGPEGGWKLQHRYGYPSIFFLKKVKHSPTSSSFRPCTIRAPRKSMRRNQLRYES